MMEDSFYGAEGGIALSLRKSARPCSIAAAYLPPKNMPPACFLYGASPLWLQIPP